MRAQKIDEILETTFTEREQGSDTAEAILSRTFAGHAPGKCAEDLDELAQTGLLRLEGGRVALTAEGELRATAVVRRHRLTERFFRQLLSLGEAQSETHACELEHILSPEATDAICTLLGHPPTCPHGKPIPPGPCCETVRRTISPLVCPLTELALDAPARVVFVLPKLMESMDQLAGLGLLPGTELKLRQRFPTRVIEMGETLVAMDAEVARSIFVQRLAEPVALRQRPS
jgi:DtxR family Mn-dependent transcriptional regulator